MNTKDKNVYELYFAGLYYLIAIRDDNGIAYFKVNEISRVNDSDYIELVLNTGEKWEVFKDTIIGLNT